MWTGVLMERVDGKEVILEVTRPYAERPDAVDATLVWGDLGERQRIVYRFVPLPIGVKVVCPSCYAKLVFGVVDDEPNDEIIIKSDCPACGNPVSMPIA